MLNIPILTYHKISNKKDFGLNTLSIHQFREQIQYLVSNGYNAVSFEDIYLKKTISDKPIILTFDDGYEEVITNAAEILSKNGFKAVVFIITDYIGKHSTWEPVSFQRNSKHLSEEQIIELSKHGFEIASHGKSHAFMPALENAELKEEFSQSKDVLEDLCGREVISFSYPYGRISQNVVAVAQETGYLYATRNISSALKNNHPHLSLHRRSVYSIDSMPTFESKLSTPVIFSYSYISEILIQQGALASIALKKFI